MWAGPFVKMAKKSELVVRAKVKSYGPRLPHGENLYASMEVELVAVIKGEYTAETFTILGDPGHLCRPYITPAKFKKGHEYLFALSKSKENPQGLSVCGEYWIKIDKELAKGQKLDKDGFANYSVNLNELLKQISED